MIASFVTSVLFAASLGVRVEAIGASSDDVRLFSDHLARELERSLGARPIFDDAVWLSCAQPSSCVGELRARTGSEDVLFVRLVEGLGRYRVLVDLFPRARPVHHVELDVLKGDSMWLEAAQRVAQVLPSDPYAIASATVAAGARVLPPAAAPPSIPALVLGGASVLAAATAIVFAIDSSNAKSDLDTMMIPPSRLDETEDRMTTGARLAAVFAGTAATLGLAAAVVVALSEP